MHVIGPQPRRLITLGLMWLSRRAMAAEVESCEMKFIRKPRVQLHLPTEIALCKSVNEEDVFALLISRLSNRQRNPAAAFNNRKR